MGPLLKDDQRCSWASIQWVEMPQSVQMPPLLCQLHLLPLGSQALGSLTAREIRSSSEGPQFLNASGRTGGGDVIQTPLMKTQVGRRLGCCNWNSLLPGLGSSAEHQKVLRPWLLPEPKMGCSPSGVLSEISSKEVFCLESDGAGRPLN